MCLLPEWNMFQQGVGIGCTGFLILIIMIIIYRKMEYKPPIHITFKTVFAIFLGIIGALGLGIGMCFSMVFEQMIVGIIAGIVGIALLLCLIPLCRGLK